MTQIDPMALFRLSVLGPLISRPLQRGEFQQTLQELAGRTYAIPGSRKTRLGEKTIAGWYYVWRKDEPPRVLWRLYNVTEWSQYDDDEDSQQDEQIFCRSA